MPKGVVKTKADEKKWKKAKKAGGIPPPQKTLPPARRSDPFGLDDFKFFVPFLAELWALPSLAANSFSKLLDFHRIVAYNETAR